MKEVIGDFKAILTSGEAERLTLSFSPGSRPIKQRWRNNGLSADFLGDYMTTFFPKEAGDLATIPRQADVKNAVTYMANELLENAMKYADERFSVPITICLEMAQDILVFSESNAIDRKQADVFRAFIDWLNSGDPATLYMEALEKSATREDGGSGLGLITMMHDYGARLAWEIAPNDDDSVVVTTQVTISV